MSFLQRIATGLGGLRIRSTGDSMLPHISPGCSLQVRAVPSKNLVEGDVIACMSDVGLIVHRMIGRVSKGLVTLGDNRSLIDPIWSRERYVGKVEGYAHRDWSEIHLDRFASGLALVLGREPRAKNLTIGVSPYGAVSLPHVCGALGRIAGQGVHLRLLTGYYFGRPEARLGERLSSPSMADLHVRIASPGEAVGPRRLSARIERLLPGCQVVAWRPPAALASSRELRR